MKNNCRVLVFRITPLFLSVEWRLDSKFTGFWPDKLLLLSDLSETKMVLHFPGQSVMHICFFLWSKLVFFYTLWNGFCFARSGSQAEGGFPKAQIYLDKSANNIYQESWLKTEPVNRRLTLATGPWYFNQRFVLERFLHQSYKYHCS